MYVRVCIYLVAPGRALLLVSVALVGHEVVQGVGPDGHAGEGGRDGGVVGEELVGHHGELLVGADQEVRGANPDHGAVGNVGETLHNQPRGEYNTTGKPINYVN